MKFTQSLDSRKRRAATTIAVLVGFFVMMMLDVMLG